MLRVIFFTLHNSLPLSSHSDSLNCLLPQKGTAPQTLFVSDFFYHLCVLTRKQCYVLCLYILCLSCIDCSEEMRWIGVKENQKTIHNKQQEWPEEWKIHKMSHVSIRDRGRDLFKLSESSFLSNDCIHCFIPLLWILNDPCTKYPPLVRVFVSVVFLAETQKGKKGGELCFWFLLVFYKTLLCMCPICALQSNHFGQSASCLGNHSNGRRTLPCRGCERDDRRECDKSHHLPEHLR